MRLTVLVPSENYKGYAGSRIRYGRVGPELSPHGVTLQLEDIGSFKPSRTDCDALLVSKCHDAQALVAAAVLKRRGALVGVDLFDDYFSDSSDSRLLRYRNWLSQMLEICDFALCSTEAMARVVRTFKDQLPVHIMNDPGFGLDAHLLSGMLRQKLAEARQGRLLRICWFGVGDNPYFPVGLADLSAWSGELAALRRSGFDVQLTVLTNRRALSADGLALLEQLPIRARVREWSEAVEQIVLMQSLLAFLPVGFQPFSRAKSLNRAVTALSYGCQVLSCGYPLYAPLDKFIYRKTGEFLDDLARGRLRSSTKSVRRLEKRLNTFASGAIEARALAAFLGRLSPSEGQSRPLSLVHGISTRSEAHEMVKGARGFSVASPFCTVPLAYDVIFEGPSLNLRMLVSRDAATRLLPNARRNLSGGRSKIRGREFLHIERRPAVSAASAGPDMDPIGITLVTYGAAMREIEDRMVQTFGPCHTIISETSDLPVLTPPPGA